jgi:hypothetical protein
MQMSFSADRWGGTNVLYILKHPVVPEVATMTHAFFFYWTGTANQLEMDTFHFVAGSPGTEYMFGTQCNFTSGVWDVWNQQTPQWVPTTTPCSLSPHHWHSIVKYDTISGSNMIFRGIRIDGVYHEWNITEPSGPLPSGWDSTEGVQWQCNIASTGTCKMYVEHDELFFNRARPMADSLDHKPRKQFRG